jgi:geranylgeranyl diphosphate synthase type II
MNPHRNGGHGRESGASPPGAARGSAWSAWSAEVGPRVERVLEEILPPEGERPRSIHRAMRYSVFSGGKRIRPALAALGYRLGGGRGEAGVRLGAALELIHTFSLIHDDLPCMDDDDYRRGRLSCHKKFGEAIAVLAGDGLMVLAFDTIAALPAAADRRLRVLSEITRAVGTAGVIGGQVVDIESEGRKIPTVTLRWMHEHKTGALMRCSLVSGALLAGAPPRLVARLAAFGEAFGLLFQIVDDLLGEVGTRSELGRPVGRDRLRGKATYPALLGLEGSRRRLRAAVADCFARVPAPGRFGEILSDLIGAVVRRLPQDWHVGVERP